MTTADWAIIISIGSVVIALASFVWNVWSKFIYPKPRLSVSASLMNSFSAEGVGPSCITIGATNLGPSEVVLHLAIAKQSKPWYRWRRQFGILNPYDGFPGPQGGTKGPFSGGLPKKLAAGETFAVHFPVMKGWFLEDDLAGFGFSDTFGRNHWAPTSQVRQLRKAVLEHKEDQPPSSNAGMTEGG